MSLLLPVLRFSRLVLAVTGIVSVLSLGNTARAQGLYELPNPQTTSPTGTTPMGVASADFTRNGYQGLVVTDSANKNIKVYLATGIWQFQANSPYTYSTCADPTAVVATDLNNDGYPDIAVTCTNGVDVFLNDGTGNFANMNGYGVPGAVALAVGNFTGNGQIDIAVASSSGSVTLLVNNKGNFTPQSVAVPVTGQLTGIVAADFNRDGHLDLAVSDASNNNVHVLLGSGTGSFTESAASPTVGSGPSGIVAADFNHDGNIDLATSNAGGNSVTVLKGSSAGSFTLASTQSAGTDPIGISLTDVNSDGNPDVVVYDASNSNSTTQGAIAVLLGNGDGTLQIPQIANLTTVPGTLAAVADFNRDGKPDLAITEQSSNQVTLLLNNTLPTPYPGGRSFSAPHQLINGYGNMADSVAVGDFNHDGLQDLAVSYLEDNAVRVLLNNGTGPSNFNPATAYTVGKQPYFIAAADLNADGYDDLVTVNTTDGTVSVLLNNGVTSPGTFGTAQTYPVGRLPFQVAIGDLNGDGIPDLAVTNMGGNSVSILFGAAGGTFTTGPTLATGVNPFGVAIGQFDHSGYPGIAVTCYHTSQLYVFPNNGNGTFGTPFITTTGSSPTSVVVGDFNRDGKLDIVTGNSIANDVSFFAGTGTGSFAAAVTSPALNFPVSIAAGDINGDGILDLVAVAPNYNQVSVTLGKGDGTFGTFQQRAEFAAGTQPWGVALGDFDNDGQLDIATANTFQRVNIASPAYQQMYMKQFPAIANGNPSINVLSNASAAVLSISVQPGGQIPANNSGVTATVSVQPALTGGTPTGSIIFENGSGAPLGNGPYPLVDGTATATTGRLGSGQYVFTSLYSGDSSFQPTTASGNSFAVTVAGTPVTLTFSPSSVPYSSSFTASVSVTGTVAGGAPQGSVTIYGSNGSSAFTIGTISLTASGNNGVGQGTFTAVGPNLNVGTYQTYAYFTPSNGTYQPGSSSSETLTVTPEATSLAVTCSGGFFSDTCTATVTASNTHTGVPAGNIVDFSVSNGGGQGTQTIGANGAASFSFGAIFGGFTVTATFPAQGNYLTSTNNTTVFCIIFCGFVARQAPILAINSLTGINLARDPVQRRNVTQQALQARRLSAPTFIPFNYLY